MFTNSHNIDTSSNGSGTNSGGRRVGTHWAGVDLRLVNVALLRAFMTEHNIPELDERSARRNSRVEMHGGKLVDICIDRSFAPEFIFRRDPKASDFGDLETARLLVESAIRYAGGSDALALCSKCGGTSDDTLHACPYCGNADPVRENV